MPYVDGFVIPLATKHVASYKKIAQKASKIWLEHGAVHYAECIGDDLKIKGMVPFTKLAGTKAGETVVFAWITYKTKAHRDSVNKKVMVDPRIAKMMEAGGVPFDCKRMAYGGFKMLVEGKAKAKKA